MPLRGIHVVHPLVICSKHARDAAVIAAACFIVVTVKRAIPGRVGGAGVWRHLQLPIGRERRIQVARITCQLVTLCSAVFQG